MKKEVGASAGILALLAIIFHTQFLPSQERPAPQPKPASASRAAAKGEPPSDDPREGPWIATRAFFNRGEVPLPRSGVPPSPPRPGAPFKSPCDADNDWTLYCLTSLNDSPPNYANLRSLLGAPVDPQNRYPMWSIIASVADPLHTRLPLLADEQIEAIQKSLLASGWELAGQWLPWKDHFDSAESDISARRHQRFLQRDQEQLPGVLIFRCFPGREKQPDSCGISDPKLAARQLLFVFVVPETPISGISGLSFIAALHMANALSNRGRVGLLAPAFSGSFESLTNLVLAWNESASLRKAGARTLEGRVYGGSISSDTNASAFSDRTGLKFHSGIASTSDYRHTLCEVLTRYGIEASDVAYIEEDESSYGASYTREIHNRERKEDPFLSCEKTIAQYKYPRDISHLRNIYQEEATSTSPQAKPQPTPGVNFSIKDPDTGEDSVPTFSDAQTPLAQSAVVDRIVEDLRRKRTRIAYIVATNSLDAVFLARMVRRESPDTRVMLGTPDVLFIPAASQDALTGALFLSTYPMFFEGDQWLNQPETTRFVFARDDIQGLYNVTQALLADLGATTKIDFQGYAQLEGDKAHPSLWLLTLNRSGFLPVDSIDQFHDSANDPHDSWFARPLANREKIAGPYRFPTPPRGWFLTAMGITAFIYCGCFLLLQGNFSHADGWSPWLDLRVGDCPVRRLIMVTDCALALSAIEWILFLPVWHETFERSASGGRPLWWLSCTLAGAFGFILPLISVLLISLIPLRKKIGIDIRARDALRLMLPAGLFLFIVGTWTWSCVPWRQVALRPAALLFSFRALEIYGGSSPALPLVFLGLGAAAGSLLCLARLTRAARPRPCLQLQSLDEIASFDEHYQNINRRIRAEMRLKPDGWQKTGGFLLLLFVAIPFIYLAWKYAAAFELRPYNIMLAAVLSLPLFWLAFICYDMTAVWKDLNQLLVLIDLFPLRPAFERFAHDWRGRPIWASPRRLLQPLVTTSMVVALHRRWLFRGTPDSMEDLKNFWDSVPFGRQVSRPGIANHRPPPNAQALPTIESIGATAVQRAPIPGVYDSQPDQKTVRNPFEKSQEHEENCAELAAKILLQDLRPLWRENLNDDTQDLTENDPEQKRSEHLTKYCADFVALQFRRYIVYVVEQIRSMAWFLSSGLLLLMIVLNSYSPQAPLLLGRFLAALFVLIGIVVFQVFAAMERHAILSRIAGTTAGELNQGFWLQIAVLGILPLLGVLVHLFPAISGYVYSWIAPGVEALH